MSVLQPRLDATSQTIGSILMVAITIVLAVLVLLLFHLPSLDFDMTPVPQIFIITSIENKDEITGLLNFDSRVIIRHIGTTTYQNKNLKALFYKNNLQVNANIPTLNGHDFISTSHTGVQWMGGMGCSGATWNPNEMTCIDLKDGTFRSGDSVKLDIIEKSSNSVISRHTFRVK